MTRGLKILAIFGGLIVAAGIAFQAGIVQRIDSWLLKAGQRTEEFKTSAVRIKPEHSPYQRWLERARDEIPVFEGLVIEDVNAIDLESWPQMGEEVSGLYLRFADYQMSDGRLLEIPGSGKTVSQRHLYEKGVYFLGGPGHTIIRQEGKAPQRLDWNKGSLFAVPLNVEHQHFNDSSEPVRLLAVTSFPLVLNVAASERFIDDNPFVFDDRYDGGDDFLEQRKEKGRFVVRTNFVDDILEQEMWKLPVRGQGNRFVRWVMAGNSMLSMHMSEMPPRMYKKAHRHSSDAFILLLSGEGYSLTWPEGGYESRVRVDWKAGTLFVPPTYWYHQHFNSGSGHARYVALNTPDLVTNLGLLFRDQLESDSSGVMEEWNRELDKKQQ